MVHKIITSLLLLFYLITPTNGNPQIAPQKHVLILNSYHEGLSWSDDLVGAIKNELNTNNRSIQLYIEYMDTKRFYSSQLLNDLFLQYKHKYSGLKLDLIICTDDNAYNFIIKYKNKIFGDIPCLFCGLNVVFTPPKGYSGVFETTNLNKTIDLIKKFHPDVKKLTVVSDWSKTGIISTDNFKQSIQLRNDSITYQFIKPNSLQELKEKLSNLKTGDVVFYLLYNKDIKGNYYSYQEGFNLTTDKCKVPIYCIRNFYINAGAIGGILTTGEMQGKLVAQMANRLLHGTPINRIKTQTAPQQLILDYKQLKRFGISDKQLPSDAHIVNLPYKFIREHKELVILIITVFLLLIIAIVFLAIIIHMRNLRIQRDRAHMKEMKINQTTLENAKEKAEESNRLKSAFLANMSHEIRTPMNAIMGFTQLLTEPNREQKDVLRYINIIQKNTQYLLQLINDILDISKIETNQLKIVKTECELSPILNALLENYQTFLRETESNITLHLTIGKDQHGITIQTDSNRLRQILTNLLENAIKFTPKGSIQFGYQHKSNHILFFVRDTGIGIPTHKREIIFDRFRQAEPDAHTRQYGGTGLGLTISKSLVKMLGGNIWVESNTPQGTSFFFTIPI